jgi:hypothetical protein
LLLKLFLAGFIFLIIALIITSLPLFQIIVNSFSIQMLKSDYNYVIIDYAIRSLFYKFFYIFPIFFFMASVLIFLPRLADLDILIQKKMALIGPKQYLMGKNLSEKLTSSIVSKKFIAVILVAGLPIIFSRYVFSNSNDFSILYLIAIIGLISVYIGFRLAQSLRKIYEELRVGKYALNHFQKSFTISALIYVIPLAILLYFVVAFNTSDIYRNQLNLVLFAPLQLFHPFSLITVNILPPNLSLVAFGSFIIVGSIVVISMIIISAVYLSGAKRVISEVLVFFLMQFLSMLIKSLLSAEWIGFLNPISFAISLTVPAFLEILRIRDSIGKRIKSIIRK